MSIDDDCFKRNLDYSGIKATSAFQKISMVQLFDAKLHRLNVKQNKRNISIFLVCVNMTSRHSKVPSNVFLKPYSRLSDFDGVTFV